MKQTTLILSLIVALTCSVSAADKKKQEKKPVAGKKATPTTAKPKPAAKKPAAKKPTPKPAPKSVFPDKNLEQAVRAQVFAKRHTKDPLTAADIAQVAVVRGNKMGIKSLAGLEHCRALASLDLAENEIVDLSPIKGLPRLQQLILHHNKVRSVAPLADNRALQYIDLNQNDVTDLKPLGMLTNMSVLYLSDNSVKDISPILKLPRLHSIYLNNNGLVSLSGINELKWLSSLSASGNKLKDLHDLTGLENLSFLFLEGNQIADINPLLKMLKGDYEGKQRFSPFIRIYLDGNPLNGKAKAGMKSFTKKYHTRFK
jgi:hypothetical protein